MTTTDARGPGAVSRRAFLGGAAGGLAVAFTLTGPGKAFATLAQPSSGTLAAATGPAAITGWVKVGTSGFVTVAFPGGEMGQGIMTGLAQAVAEELKVPWGVVVTEAAPAAQSYITGGSTGIRNHLQPMLLAGAQAREMLIAAAADTWGVAASACSAPGDGTVVRTGTADKLTYASLATKAATMPVPSDPPLTPPSAYKILGKSMNRIDIPSKTTGKAIYGIDVRVPGMVYAVVVHSPTLGGTLSSTPPVPPGATGVVNLGNAVAVVGTNTWQALNAAQELQASWKAPADAAAKDSAAISSTAQQLLVTGTPLVAETSGDVDAALAGATKQIDATYTLPFLAHGYMEVLNCTASVTATSCEVWAPTQAPGWVAGTAAAVTGLAADKIKVHTTLMGGGLGRKIEQDYVQQAITVSKSLGKPVKLMWSREQDMSQDQYRPMALARVQAGLDAAGKVVGWSNRIVTQSILGQRGRLGPGQVDSSSVDGAVELPYNLGAKRVEWVPHPSAIPVGFWRSVGNSLNCFVVESAIDELALAAGKDPLAFRRTLLGTDTRAINVLNQAAFYGGWSAALPAGHARGIALTRSFGSIVAEVVEISQPVAGSITVHKVAVAIDCGTAVNPGQVKAQMEGGVIHALSAALWGEVTFTNGRANQRNFNRYRVLKLKETPKITVSVIQSGQPIGGVGEPAVPPLAPALANAYARLTGTRVRSLPFFPGSVMSDL